MTTETNAELYNLHKLADKHLETMLTYLSLGYTTRNRDYQAAKKEHEKVQKKLNKLHKELCKLTETELLEATDD